MNDKELILKRLLEQGHITIEEMFILNELKIVTNERVVIKEIKPYDTSPIPLPWIRPNEPNPYWYNTITCDTNLLRSKLPSDYKMD